MIPTKKNIKNGKYRLAMQDFFIKPLYNFRNIVETIISILKRIFDYKNYSMNNRQRNKETKLKKLPIHYVKRLSGKG